MIAKNPLAEAVSGIGNDQTPAALLPYQQRWIADESQLKIADKSANLNSILQTPPHDWSATRKRRYFAWAAEVVGGCRGVNAWIEAVFDERLSLGRF